MDFAPTLTNRELRALIAAANGKERTEIAEELDVDRHDAKNILNRVIIKLGADNLPHAIAIGFCTGIITEYNIDGFYVDPRKTTTLKAVR